MRGRQKDDANIAGVLTEDEARRIANNIAKPPELVGSLRMMTWIICRMSAMRPKTPRRNRTN
jgi:hypothetical protein